MTFTRGRSLTLSGKDSISDQYKSNKNCIISNIKYQRSNQYEIQNGIGQQKLRILEISCLHHFGPQAAEKRAWEMAEAGHMWADSSTNIIMHTGWNWHSSHGRIWQWSTIPKLSCIIKPKSSIFHDFSRDLRWNWKVTAPKQKRLCNLTHQIASNYTVHGTKTAMTSRKDVVPGTCRRVVDRTQLADRLTVDGGNPVHSSWLGLIHPFRWINRNPSRQPFEAMNQLALVADERHVEARHVFFPAAGKS